MVKIEVTQEQAEVLQGILQIFYGQTLREYDLDFVAGKPVEFHLEAMELTRGIQKQVESAYESFQQDMREIRIG